MPSSSRPYKSKLLRFVLQQWQQGLERQDRAWRQLQSTTAWGAQVAVFPLYAIMRSLERARFILGQSTAESEQPAEPIPPAQGNVTDLEHSLTAIFSHTQQLLSSEQKGQLAIAPKSSMPRTATHLLVTVVDRIRQQFPKRFRAGRNLTTITKSQHSFGQLTTHNRTQQKQGHLTTGGAADIQRRTTQSGLAQNGMTLASSLKTRNLVLVNLKNEVFDILTPAQQQDLKHYITRVMHAYQQSRTIVPHQPKQLSVKTILAIGGVFLAALPMEFRKAWSQIAPGPELPDLPPPISSPQPRSRIFYPQSSARNTVKTRARLQGEAIHSTVPVGRRLSSNSPDAFEASVNDVSYLEHPLEKILRWLDRVLTWCERRW